MPKQIPQLSAIVMTHMSNLKDDYISTVWLKVKTGPNCYVNIMGGYRQWKYPMILNFPGSEVKSQQIERFEMIATQIKKVKNTGHDLLIAWDSKIDLLPQNYVLLKHNIKRQ